MALASVGFFVNVVLADSGGNKSTLRIKLISADIETAVTDAGAVVAALNPITDAVITSYSVGEQYDESGSHLAAEGVQIENVALVSARILNAQEKWAILRVPAPNIGIFLAATGTQSNEVDPADSQLVTYLNLFVLTTGIATLSDGETLVAPGTPANVKGKRIHRGSRKG